MSIFRFLKMSRYGKTEMPNPCSIIFKITSISSASQAGAAEI